jgi:hypothetical protein
MRNHALLILAFMAMSPAQAEPINPLIDFDGFSQLTAEVAPYRSARLVSPTFDHICTA